MKNYFAHYAPVIMDLLGIKAWTKDSNQKDSLLEEQKQKLKALSFDENFITGFCEALKNGFPEDSSSNDGDSDTEGGASHADLSNAVTKGLLADMTAKLVTAQEEIAVLTKEKGELSQEVSAKQTEITGLQTKIQALSGLAEQDGGERFPARTSGTGR